MFLSKIIINKVIKTIEIANIWLTVFSILSFLYLRFNISLVNIAAPLKINIAPEDCVAEIAITPKIENKIGEVFANISIKYKTRLPSLNFPMKSGNNSCFEISRLFNTGFAPSKCEPIPIIIKNIKNIIPITKDDTKICCVIKIFGVLDENAIIENAGDACIPMKVITYVNIIVTVQIPPTGFSLETPFVNCITSGTANNAE